jgi:hypothetical protein
MERDDPLVITSFRSVAFEAPSLRRSTVQTLPHQSQIPGVIFWAMATGPIKVGHYDSQHKGLEATFSIMTLSITTRCSYADVVVLSVAFYLLLC